MKIRAGYEISFHTADNTPLVLLLSVHPSERGRLITPDFLRTTPTVEVAQHLDLFGNLASRVIAPGGPITLRSEFEIEDSGEPEPHDWDARQHPVGELPDDALPFLLGSRYCEVDSMCGLAWSLFGSVPEGWPRLQAILDYTHQRLSFGYEHARNTRTAWEAHKERVGVCRDFAHLAVTLCRCMNIPARYCTGYLGDIGVPPVDAPMDFSAWFEVYLGDRWHTVDARHNSRRIGRIVVAKGRDATDVAMSTAFGQADLIGFRVITDELPEAPATMKSEWAPPLVQSFAAE